MHDGPALRLVVRQARILLVCRSLLAADAIRTVVSDIVVMERALVDVLLSRRENLVVLFVVALHIILPFSALLRRVSAIMRTYRLGGGLAHRVRTVCAA